MVKVALFAPLLSAFFLFVLGTILRKKEVAVIGCFIPILSFFLFLMAPFGETFGYWFFQQPPVAFSLLFDPLSKVYALVITGVGSLIHLFSIGYMDHEEEPAFARYFAQLNLFIFSMLLLVLSDSLLFLFFGWELVGLCSYLLIGFWFRREAPSLAARKAFLANRLGDLFFVAALALLFYLTGSFSFREIFAHPLTKDERTIAALFLFLAATGKSAQLPLYLWLPDAMEGPTPVSALIHAATMVTAGVYLLLRLFPIFDGTPTMALVAYVGALTALYAALVASFQEELKKVLAYSTVSQLGLMFVALGCGGYLAALFHFLTHAFFKSLLFLCAGAIMHACGGEQRLSQLGGLAKKMPWTHISFLTGALALSGIFPFSGFFSKDGILSVAFSKSWRIYLLAQVASALTAYYAFRMVYLAFFGTYRGKGSPHDPQGSMLLPLILLALLSLAGGVFELSSHFHPLADFVRSSLPLSFEKEGALVPLVSQGFGLLGILSAILFAKSIPSLSFFQNDGFQKWLQPLYRLSHQLSLVLSLLVDQFIVDGIVNGVGALAQGLAEWGRLLVSGSVRVYLASFSLAFLLFLFLFIYG